MRITGGLNPLIWLNCECLDVGTACFSPRGRKQQKALGLQQSTSTLAESLGMCQKIPPPWITPRAIKPGSQFSITPQDIPDEGHGFSG